MIGRARPTGLALFLSLRQASFSDKVAAPAGNVFFIRQGGMCSGAVGLDLIALCN